MLILDLNETPNLTNAQTIGIGWLLGVYVTEDFSSKKTIISKGGKPMPGSPIKTNPMPGGGNQVL
jgi:hypothetical protein